MEHKVPTKTSPTTPTLPTAHQQLFTATMMSLTWQLVIIVLVPTIGGHFIDQAANSTPRWTIVGLVLAVLLSAASIYNGYSIVTRQLKEDAKHD